MFRRLALLSVVALAAGCHDSGVKAGAGQACTATVDCAGNLVCLAGFCGGSDGGATSGSGGDGGPPCLDPGASCTAGGSGQPCCSGVCAPDDGGAMVCGAASFCGAPGAACTASTDCCLLDCQNGTCAASLCVQNGQACGADSDCCSATCTGGTCGAVPGSSCGTLGQACTGGGDCCSTNCQGGRCVRAFGCNASGDLCFDGTDCCSGACSATADGGAGVCVALSGGGSGGCMSDGEPCSGGTNCCSRLCVDPGSGATVCAPASGCRLTGDLCATDSDCCGFPDNGVTCTLLSQNPPLGRCANPTGCQPVGNICGAFGANARQDCCDGKKAVCGLDAEGIARCFGGCPNGDCGSDCPQGYATGGDGGCCIGSGDECQFKDQCCDGSPCLPGDGGVLRCTPAPSCGAAGSSCNPASASVNAGCCEGLSCLEAGGELSTGFACQAPQPPVDGGASIDAGASDAGPSCAANGGACQFASDCCSSYCVGGVCSAQPACEPQSGACTSSGDCCLGLTCAIPGGATVGTCQPGASCGQPGQACTSTASCCAGLGCLDSSGASCSGGAGCTCGVIFR